MNTEKKGTDIFTFVKDKLGEYKVSGKEIIVKKCPYCGKEKHKFSINTEKGLYQCFSGSCRETGTIGKLYRKYGLIDYSGYNPKIVDIKEYCQNITENVKEFLLSRGITEKTVKQNFFDIMSTVNKEISFIYRKGFDVHSIKCRKTDTKEFRGKKLKDLTLWKLDYCDTTFPLIICEGELDQLSFEEQGIQNSVSVPAGCSSLSWIDTDFEQLEKFKEIILAFDSDQAGKEAVKKIFNRLPETVLVKSIDFGIYKDANEVHLANGDLKKYINSAETVDYEEYIKFSEIDIHSEEKRYSTGSLEWNRAIGCIRMGEVSIYTGSPGSGKSTALMQLALEVASQNGRPLIYTPELSDKQIKRWTLRQMLGRKHDDKTYTWFDKMEEKQRIEIKKEHADKMSVWIDRKINFISSKVKKTQKEMLKTISRDIKKYKTDFIIIDNLMKLIFENENDIWTEQKSFLDDLSTLAKTHNVSINLVAHPKKHDIDAPDIYDIAGSANMPNLVDNIYYFRRIVEEHFNRKNCPFKDKKEEIINNDVSSAMISLKSREGKSIGKWELFTFDVVRKRFNFYKDKIHFNDEWEIEKEIIDPDEEAFFKLMEQY